jgi:hypothetical protein
MGDRTEPADMVTHPAYQQIIGLGKEALPLLFGELRRAPDHWFWALRAITESLGYSRCADGQLEVGFDAQCRRLPGQLLVGGTSNGSITNPYLPSPGSDRGRR